MVWNLPLQGKKRTWQNGKADEIRFYTPFLQGGLICTAPAAGCGVCRRMGPTVDWNIQSPIFQSNKIACLPPFALSASSRLMQEKIEPFPGVSTRKGGRDSCALRGAKKQRPAFPCRILEKTGRLIDIPLSQSLNLSRGKPLPPGSAKRLYLKAWQATLVLRVWMVLR